MPLPVSCLDPTGEFFCTHTISDTYTMPNFHIHLEYEYLFLISGSLLVENNADTAEVNAPALIIHKPYTPHRANTPPTHTGKYERYVLNFSGGLLSELNTYISDAEKITTSGLSIIRLTPQMVCHLQLFFSQIHTESAANCRNRCALLLALITDSLTCYITPANTVHSSSSIPYISDLLEYLSKNFDRNIPLTDLADRFFISRAKLVSDFRAATGTSIKQYVKLVRLSTAMLLLHSHSVTETAALCGFCDDSHFISVFHAYTGKTPKEFARRMEMGEHAPGQPLKGF